MITINLLPPAHREARQQAKLVRRWMGAGAAYGLLLVMAAGVARVFNTVDDHSLYAEISKVKTAAAQLETQQGRLGETLGKLQNQLDLRDAVNSPADYSAFLAAMGESLNQEAVLTSLRWDMTPAGPAAPIAAGAGDKPKVLDPLGGPVRLRVEIAGVTREQPAVGRVVAAIQQTGLFDEVRLTKSSREGFLALNGYSFQIQCVSTAPKAGGRQ